MSNHFKKFALPLLIFSLPTAAWALDQFEIQVYDAEINSTNQDTLENHVNYVIAGMGDPSFAGQIPSNHVLHVTQELARGMTEYWELGLYYQSGITFPAAYHYAGIKLRSKFVVPKRLSGSFQWGANFEISGVPRVFEDVQYAVEVRPIFGYTLEAYTFLFNPILGWNLTGESASGVPELSPAVKLIWDTKRHFAVGLEYYGGIGALNNIPSPPNQEHALYGAFDLLDEALELNVGVGKGLTDVANGWTVKTIVGFKL